MKIPLLRLPLSQRVRLRQSPTLLEGFRNPYSQILILPSWARIRQGRNNFSFNQDKGIYFFSRFRANTSADRKMVYVGGSIGPKENVYAAGET
jgi:hypothetical protein